MKQASSLLFVFVALAAAAAVSADLIGEINLTSKYYAVRTDAAIDFEISSPRLGDKIRQFLLLMLYTDANFGCILLALLII